MEGLGLSYLSEIRPSEIAALLEKVKKGNYGKYLRSVRLAHVRAFNGPSVIFEFPVTALIGPNGGGKSTVLGAAACAYKDVKPGMFFPKSAIGDDTMADWGIEYSLIDKSLSVNSEIRRGSRFKQLRWKRSDVLARQVLYFGIERTVPAGEKPRFKKLMKSSYQPSGQQRALGAQIATQVEKILGRSVIGFQVADIEGSEQFHVGGDGTVEYSEFHFGAGEASIIRMVSAVESAEDNTLILVEEIENGLHPIATRRLVEYFIDVAGRKSCQVIFTTHSDYALDPLPPEAIWAATDGQVQQGKLSVETLRAVSGRVDTEVVIFVEDEFAKCWVDAALRERLRERFDQVEVHAVAGDGNARRIHMAHRDNPAIESVSLCFLDGDSQQLDDVSVGVFRLPGAQPETYIVEVVTADLDADAAILTVSMHRQPEAQQDVIKAIRSVLAANRDPHLLFNQIGMEIGFVAEVIVRGAFLSQWAVKRPTEVDGIVGAVESALKQADAAC
jgi:ABC-type multidrug transport system ATPase subunit